MFSHTAIEILEDRYLLKDPEGNIVETPEEMLMRVSKCVANGDVLKEKLYYEVMENLDFFPNSPTLMNAGRAGIHGQLSACFVLDVEDSMEGIFDALKSQAIIQKTGGGTGFNFSKLRHKDALVNTTNGRASGAVSFMELFDFTSEKVQQGGMRRGANMGILNVDHKDIEEFVDCKHKDGKLTNFNISVGITDKFMEDVYNKDKDALKLWNKIVSSAWKRGDPGVVFLDALDKDNPTPHLGKLTATNPCGESPLLPNEACNLGSINVSNFYLKDGFDWDRFDKTVRIAVNFLDDVITVNRYPLKEIKDAVLKTRKIGLGLMGFADLLIKMGINYDSPLAREFGGNLMKRLKETATDESERMTEHLNPFDAYHENCGYPRRRNATLTCIAPTGTISIIAGCSSGIEPNFAFSCSRRYNTKDGKRAEMIMNHPVYEEIMSIENDPRQSALVTAHEVSVIGHIGMQSSFQQYVDLAVSKTINLPSDATKEDVDEAYKLAWKSGCKGVTIYRDGSKNLQVLTKLCEKCSTALTPTDGCYVCEACGWSPCS